MKKIAGCLFVVLLSVACQSSKTQEEDAEMKVASEADTAALLKKNEQLPSPRRNTTGLIASTSITIDWGSPAVKSRTIWGDLVPWGEIWRAGANENTTIYFDEPVVISRDTIPAGKYGLFIIPEEDEEWVVIINEKNDAWGHFEYSRSEDVIRVNVSSQKLDDIEERLNYSITDEGVVFSWEYVKFLLPISA